MKSNYCWLSAFQFLCLSVNFSDEALLVLKKKWKDAGFYCPSCCKWKTNKQTKKTQTGAARYNCVRGFLSVEVNEREIRCVSTRTFGCARVSHTAKNIHPDETHPKSLSAEVNSFERRLSRPLNKATRSHVFCAKTGFFFFFFWSSVHPVPFPAFYPVAAAFNQMVWISILFSFIAKKNEVK